MRNVVKCMPLLIVGLMSQPVFALADGTNKLLAPSPEGLVPSYTFHGDHGDEAGAGDDGDDGEGDGEASADAGGGEGDMTSDALAAALAGAGGGTQVKDLFDIFDYDGEATLAQRFVGEWPKAARLFVGVVADPKPYLNHIAAHSMPLLIAGPTSVGKSALVHTIAADSKARLWELDFGNSDGAAVSEQMAEAHGVVLRKALDAIEDELESNENLKVIIHLKKYHSEMPLQDIITDKKYKELFERVFIVASLDVSELKDTADIIAHIDMFFRCTLKEPSVSVKQVVLARALAKRHHALTQDDIASLATKLEKFDAAKFDKLLDVAYALSLSDSCQPDCSITKAHVKAAMHSKLFDSAPTLDYFM